MGKSFKQAGTGLMTRAGQASRRNRGESFWNAHKGDQSVAQAEFVCD